MLAHWTCPRMRTGVWGPQVWTQQQQQQLDSGENRCVAKVRREMMFASLRILWNCGTACEEWDEPVMRAGCLSSSPNRFLQSFRTLQVVTVLVGKLVVFQNDPLRTWREQNKAASGLQSRKGLNSHLLLSASKQIFSLFDWCIVCCSVFFFHNTWS